MNAMTASRANAGHTIPFPLMTKAAPTRAFVDPLDADSPDDDVVVTTRRAISRVALVATETAGRFQREGVAHDPMTWMLSPRALFSGSTALDACLARDACLRGILLHGLSLGLDADPAVVDALTDADDDDDAEADGAVEIDGIGFGGFGSGPAGMRPRRDGADDEPRLFTATVVADDGFEIVQAFHASLAIDEAEIAGRLYMRMGAAMADAVIVAGFDPANPLVAALVSPAICDTLALVAADPRSPLAAGIDLNVEQRFLN